MARLKDVSFQISAVLLGLFLALGIVVAWIGEILRFVTTGLLKFPVVSEQVGVWFDGSLWSQVFICPVVIPSTTHTLGVVKVGRWHSDVGSCSSVP